MLPSTILRMARNRPIDVSFVGQHRAHQLHVRRVRSRFSAARSEVTLSWCRARSHTICHLGQGWLFTNHGRVGVNLTDQPQPNNHAGDQERDMGVPRTRRRSVAETE